MGVHGLWNLLEPVGKPVPLESLENKILAVDVSIWLHQATKGFRDAQGNPLPNAHLLGLCHRLCKLLFYKIKPVFVFDGGVPLLKRQTIAARQSRRNVSIQNNNKIAEKLLANYIKSEVINKELGKQGKGKAFLPKRKQQEPDLFELPPQAHIQNLESESESSDEFEEVGDLSTYLRGHTIHSVDVTSAEFLSLPPEIQHEILLELKDTRKQSSWNKINQMPQEAKDFSGFQIERLLKRRNLQQRLNEVEKEISRKNHETFDLDALGNSSLITERIVSDSSTHYVLIKKALEKKEIAVPKKEAKETRSSITDEPVICSLSDEEDLTQEEILAITIESSAQQTKPLSNSVIQTLASTSEEDSDFEEVPETVDEPKMVLSVPIDPDELTSDEDMFADIFGKPGACNQFTSTAFAVSSIPLEKNSSDHPDFLLGSRSKNLLTSIDLPVKDVVLTEVPTVELQSKIFIGDKFKQSGSVESLKSAEAKGEKNTSISVMPEQLIFQDQSAIHKDDLVKENSAAILISEATPTADMEPNDPGTKTSSNLAPSVTTDETLNTKSKAIKTTPEEAIVIAKVTSPTVVIEQSNVDQRLLSETTIKESMPALEKTFEEPHRQPPVLDEAYRQRLEEMDRMLYEEQYSLVKERGRQERLATTMTEQIYVESQEMLRYFGIPYIVAPLEAEAQCAYFDEVGITHGTITDDSDIWLFGGRRVYKNFFNQSKYVEFFEADDVEKLFRMRRQQMISLALLTGSDYTEGLQGVGPVYALEILAEFPGEGLEQLENFKEWLDRVQKAKNAPPGNKFREKLRNLKLIPGFPNKAVVEAYLNPEVNKSRERFSWGEPDLESLRDYLQEKIGWNREKFNGVVAPVLERFKNKEYQTRIDSFFSTKFSVGSKTRNISKRVLNAINKAADFQSSLDGEDSVDTTNGNKKTNTESKKRRREGNGSSAALKRNKKGKPLKTNEEPSPGSSNGNISPGDEKIFQREKDRQILAMNKLKAIETLKRSRGRGKRLPQRAPLPQARLSDSDSSSS